MSSTSEAKKIPVSNLGPSNGFQFMPPGDIKDFPSNPQLQGELEQLWHLNLTGFTNQALVGSTWSGVNSPAPTNYYNPATSSDNPTAVPNAAVTWIPFPGRFQTYYQPASQKAVLTDDQLLELADTGYYTDGTGQQQTFPVITAYPCTAFNDYPVNNQPCGCAGDPKDTIKYGPYGPRGWQDEYCEWSVTRDGSNNITRIDITCENPEYWNSLWMVSPEKVLELYQEILGKPNIKMDDLILKNNENIPVIDPSTGRAAYNPLNIWNNGPISSATAGGAMHLTSTPNTLQTEIALGAMATIPRLDANGNPINPSDIQSILCSAQYGQYGRNSDPNIGALVNLATKNAYGTLANPPGLYIQMPSDYAPFKIAGVSDVSTYFKATRAGGSFDIQGTEYTMNLHVTIEAPAGMPALSTMTVDGKPLKWASQIMKYFNMAIFVATYGSRPQQALGCSSSIPNSQAPWQAQPVQLFHYDIYKTMVTRKVPNPVNQPMVLLSNSTYIAAKAKPGNKYRMVATYYPSYPINEGQAPDKSKWPVVSFDNPDISVVVTAAYPAINYAVPGNSYPSVAVGIEMDVTISRTVPPGIYSLSMQDPGQAGTGPSMPAMLHVEVPILSN